MKTLRECIAEAEAKKIAIGHFNISNIEGFFAVVNPALRLNVPVIIGASEGERDFIGVHQIAVLVKEIRERIGHPIFLNADHTYSFERVKEAIDTGFDAVIIDGAKLSLEENITQTKKCVEYAREVSKKTGRDILVEAEIGFIGQSSKILDAVPTGVGLSGDALTKPEDADFFVKQTGVDLLAPSVGNFHGIVRNSGAVKKLDAERIELIRKTIGIPLVLHGGSGSGTEEFTNAIKHGISIVHINTELRVAYKLGLEKGLAENPNEVAPYKYLKPACDMMEKVVEEKLRVFNFL